MVREYNRRKTARLNDELFDYVERESKKGFELSKWVREKLIERMERGPDQIRYEIEKCKALKEKINAHFDAEIATLMEKLEAAEKAQCLSDGKDVSRYYIVYYILHIVSIVSNTNIIIIIIIIIINNTIKSIYYTIAIRHRHTPYTMFYMPFLLFLKERTMRENSPYDASPRQTEIYNKNRKIEISQNRKIKPYTHSHTYIAIHMQAIQFQFLGGFQ